MGPKKKVFLEEECSGGEKKNFLSPPQKKKKIGVYKKIFLKRGFGEYIKPPGVFFFRREEFFLGCGLKKSSPRGKRGGGGIFFPSLPAPSSSFERALLLPPFLKRFSPLSFSLESPRESLGLNLKGGRRFSASHIFWEGIFNFFLGKGVGFPQLKGKGGPFSRPNPSPFKKAFKLEYSLKSFPYFLLGPFFKIFVIFFSLLVP